MKEERKVKMMFSKNGQGFDTTRITIPVPWARELGFTSEDREGILEIENNEIILRKK